MGGDRDKGEAEVKEFAETYLGKWVTIFRGKVVSIGETYDESARKAMQEYGEKPMVTRHVVPEGEERYWIL